MCRLTSHWTAVHTTASAAPHQIAAISSSAWVTLGVRTCLPTSTHGLTKMVVQTSPKRKSSPPVSPGSVPFPQLPCPTTLPVLPLSLHSLPPCPFFLVPPPPPPTLSQRQFDSVCQTRNHCTLCWWIQFFFPSYPILCKYTSCMRPNLSYVYCHSMCKITTIEII
jgi:hypothetical protein